MYLEYTYGQRRKDISAVRGVRMTAFDKVKAMGLKIKNKEGVFIDPMNQEEFDACIIRKKVADIKDEPFCGTC